MSAVAPLEAPVAPPREGGLGPLTAARIKRLGLLYLLVASFGLLLAQCASTPGLQAFGLGLVLPGGGFLHFATGGVAGVLAHVGCFALSLLLFVVGLVLWFGTGNQLAPPTMWLLAAVAAGAMGHPHTLGGSSLLVVALASAIIGGGIRQYHRNVETKRARAARRNASIRHWPAVDSARDVASGLPQVGELSPDDIAALRFALDRALQPVDGFEGFDIIEQFQPSALRYQINNLGYVLSFANYTHLPALRGYLHEAQRNLAEKKKAHRVWQYWALENLWGNFSTNPDPIARDNIMYSGWYAAQLGLFETVTGDARYQAPGAITLTDKQGRQYVHDFPGIIDCLVENERASPFCLFPCEPNWIYPLCNNQSAVGIKTFDRLHGTHYWRDIDPLYRGYLEREFVDVDGHMVLIRSTRTGFTIPGLSNAKEDAIFAFWMHPVFPDLARRLWGISRAELFTTQAGKLSLTPLKPWLDPGNYRFNTAYYLGALGMAARELGDEEALAALQPHVDALEQRRAGGVLSYPGCSTWTHAFLLKMRLGRANAMADLVNHGMPAAWRDGPVIADARYPEVLVARAVSDGATLEAVCYPGLAAGPVQITLGQLRPNLRYRCAGAEENSAVADGEGRLVLTLNLEGRHELRVSPML